MEVLQAEIIAGEHTDRRYLDVAENILSHIKAEPENMKHYTALYSVLSSMNNCAEKWRYSETLKRYCTERIIQNKSKDASSLFKAVLLLEAQGLRLDSYMQYIELQREPEKRFWIPRRKQLEPVCRAMQKLVDGELDILSISLPPGTGKSTLEIFLHSMMIGAFPDSCSLASGHSGTLTNSIYDGVNSILSDPDYLWHDVYPAAGTIITNAKEQTIDLGKKHRFSSLTCRAIGASLTGATRCEKLLTADDLVSGIEEALSIERLDKLWTAYTNDLKSRKKLNCKELHLATRWSVHDPIGRLQLMYADSPKAQFLVMPAVDEDGESNFNYRYGVGFDKEYFEDMKNNLDDCSWRALFMNQPIEREGLLYNEDELRRYFELPSDSPDAVISVCDTKDKGADYCVMPIAYQYGNDFYIEEIICDNSNPEIVETRLVEVLLRHKVKLSRFESNSAGGKIAEKVQKEVKSRGGITRITTKYSTANKATRIIVDSPFVKEHFLFKDNSVIKNNKEYKRAIGMLCSYTMAGRNAHDDVPDAFSMLSDFIQSFETQTVRVIQRPY
jgi:predicted phage terminase large subunit-like protein